MALISDFLLAAGAFGAALYCYVLSRRLARFTRLESGMGGAIAVLSAQVDDMTRALTEARGAAHASTESLSGLTRRAEEVAGRIELLLASMHDLPEPGAAPRGTAPHAPQSPPPSPPESAQPKAPLVAERKLHFSHRRGRRRQEAPLVLTEAAE